MDLSDLETQIQRLQQQAEALRDETELPAAWRKRERGADWYRYLNLPPAQHELFRSDGWEPLYRRQRAMEEARARMLTRHHKGVALVRATEAHHGIH